MQIDRITKFSRGYTPRLDQLVDSTYVYRFREDVRLQILPVRVSQREPCAFEFVPGNQDVLLKTATLFSEPYRFSRNWEIDERTEVAEIIDEFIRFVAGDLAIKGVSFWEIANATGQRHIEDTAPVLVWISGDVQERQQCIRQSRTRLDETSCDETTVDLPKKKAAIFWLPEHLGPPSAQRRSLEVLEQASTIMPRFCDGISGAENNESGFQYKDFTSAQFGAIAKAMRSWGWMSNVQTLEYVTEFYSVINRLKFHQALAYLRSDIVCEMNTILKQVGIETKITINGLLTADEISDLTSKVRKGSISFDQAMEPIQS